MFAHVRWSRLLEILGRQGQISVGEAVEALGVSPATVRRDLDRLAAQQLLTRTHGGAVISTVTYDLPIRYKVARQADEKQRIARAAAALVPLGAVVGLNGGTTTSEVARELATRADLAQRDDGTALTVVTNAVNIAGELAIRPQVKTVVTGGVVRPDSYELTGPLASMVLAGLTLDFAILGVDSISPESSAATHDVNEAGTNRAMAEQAGTVIVVADSTKLGRRAFARVCPIDAISVLVTDNNAPVQFVERFSSRGVHVLCV